MIVRLWKGRVPVGRADEYLQYQEEVGPPNYAKVPGVRGIYLLGRELGDEYEVALLTFWDSLDAIRGFAGDPVDRARYYERDFSFLIDPPETVDHYEVLTDGVPESVVPPSKIGMLAAPRAAVAEDSEAAPLDERHG